MKRHRGHYWRENLTDSYADQPVGALSKLYRSGFAIFEA